LSLADAVKMGATNPAVLMGLDKGALAAGMDADILITDEDFIPQTIFKGGVCM
jgi:dihydroorotase-like cyclic amidohydrolase